MADDDYTEQKNSGLTIAFGTAAMLAIASLPCCRDDVIDYSDVVAGAAFLLTLAPFVGGYLSARRYENSQHQRREGDKLLSADWQDTLKEYVDE